MTKRTRKSTGRRRTTAVSRTATSAHRRSGARRITHATCAAHPISGTTADWIATRTLRTLNDALTGLEKSADYTLTMIEQLGRGKSNTWLKNWRGWATRFNTHELIHLAHTQAATWERDFNRLTHGIMRTIRKTSHAWTPTSETLMHSARHNFNEVYRRIEQSPLLHLAKDVVDAGRQEVFDFLNIPSQEEIERLQRKVTTLEQRMSTVMLRGGRHR